MNASEMEVLAARIAEKLLDDAASELLTTAGIAKLLHCSEKSVRRYRGMDFFPTLSLTPRSVVLAALPKINEYRARKKVVPLSIAA